MAAYINTLCYGCKLPIGRRDHQKYIDEVTGLKFVWHADGIRDCWNEALDQALDEYYRWFIYGTQQKEVA
ncbi:MAG: hypothetical protein NUV90_00140 [Candidatus Parcubacteria bacterium]|nr:hypothetical protein [Candidatus Parcubacteria bacterium]